MGDLIRNISDLPVRDRVQITATGMRIEGPLDYDEWLNLMSGLQRIGGAWQWAVGDGLVHGELKWGERYAQAVAVADEVGLAPATIQKLQWLCDRVPYHVRQPSLGVTHHLQVATLDVEAQERILRACAENGATVNDVKDAVKKHRAIQAGEPDPGKDLDLTTNDDGLDFSKQQQLEVALSRIEGPPIDPDQKKHLKILGFKRAILEETAWVYALVHQGRVVYVGKTTNSVHRRCREHRASGKQFDDVWVRREHPDHVDDAEARCITAFMPPLNVVHPKTDEEKMWEVFCHG